jgi:hypothetical protein
MSEGKVAPPDAVETRSALVRAAASKTQALPALACSLVVASRRVAEAVGGVGLAEAPDLAHVRIALDELASARRTFDHATNEVVEITDRMLDAFDDRTRHVLR